MRFNFGKETYIWPKNTNSLAIKYIILLCNFNAVSNLCEIIFQIMRQKTNKLTVKA